MDPCYMSSGPQRFASLDALRGCTLAAMLLVNDPGDWDHVYVPLEHAAWNGCTPTDLVFPFFLFVVGVSVALAIPPRLAQGTSAAALTRAALGRALRIVLLGVAINVLAAWLLPGAHLRFPGVLQRFGVCFAGVALFAIHTKPRTQWSAIVLLLLGYGGLLLLGGSPEPWTNIVSRTDTAALGRYVYLIDPATGRGHDPEGLLSTLPALASALLGLRAGCSLRAGKRKPLLIAGVLAVLLGALWALWLPLNKNLWTSSFVVWTTGWATLALLAFHWQIDRRSWPALGRQLACRLRRLRTDAGRAARAGPGVAVPAPVRRLDDAAVRGLHPVAGVCRDVRGAVVADRAGDGSTAGVPQISRGREQLHCPCGSGVSRAALYAQKEQKHRAPPLLLGFRHGRATHPLVYRAAANAFGNEGGWRSKACFASWVSAADNSISGVTLPPISAAIATPSRYSTREPASAGTLSPTSTVPTRFSGSLPLRQTSSPSSARWRTARNGAIASGRANCSPTRPSTKRPPRTSPRASSR
jgi:predicted acyltransferase